MRPGIRRIDDENLRHRVRALPLEIRNKIKAHTFTIPTKTLIIINKNHKPPSILQVSRTIRKRLLKDYYLRNSFWAMCITPDQLLAWFASVPRGVCRIGMDLRVPGREQAMTNNGPRTALEGQLDLVILYARIKSETGGWGLAF